MRVKCSICGLEVEKSKEEIQKLNMLSKTGKVRPEKILKLLDIYEGGCGEDDEHVFSWNLDFLKQVDELKSKHKGLGEKKLDDEKEFEKTVKEIEELTKKLEAVDKVKESLSEQLAKINEEIPIIENSFEEITGTKDLSEWK